jgi:glycosyltransferase involved in cell wall biosynthesis
MRMDDIRWFASNAYTSLLTTQLRRLGLSISLEGNRPARLALSMSGATAEEAWRYARSHGCPLVLYLWDLHPYATSSGAADPVWSLAGRLIRLPRPFGGFPSRRGYYSRLRYIAARAREVWVPSELTRIALETRFGVSSRQVPYCYDSNRFQPGNAARDDPPTLLTVSRLQRYKNQAATLLAAAQLGQGVQVHLIGRGPEREALQRLADASGVRCRIDTEADDRAVSDAYLRARVAVCPSRFEGFGLTPIEAVASGTPTVASAIPPHREFVGSAARLFPLDNLAALTEAVRAALSDPPPDSALVQDLTLPAAADRFLGFLRPLLG